VAGCKVRVEAGDIVARLGRRRRSDGGRCLFWRRCRWRVDILLGWSRTRFTFDMFAPEVGCCLGTIPIRVVRQPILLRIHNQRLWRPEFRELGSCTVIVLGARRRGRTKLFGVEVLGIDVRLARLELARCSRDPIRNGASALPRATAPNDDRVG
jgi:hypothetical protein